MLVEKQAHKHTMAVKYIEEILDKLGKKRWLIIDYCTGCEYSSARGITFKKPVLNTETLQ